MQRSFSRVLAGALFLLGSLAVSAAPAWAMIDAGGAGEGGGPAGPVSSGGTNGALVAGIVIAAVVAAAAAVLLVLRAVRRRRLAAALPATMPERIPSGAGQAAETERPQRAAKAA